MACPSIARLETNITATINTRTVPLGTPTDADTLPSYEVYEETGDTALLSGTLSKITNLEGTIKGFYGVSLLISASLGFELNKTYLILIRASVAGREGQKSYSFTILY